jgi:hypothetical protein
MIENATNLTNTTSLTSASDGFIGAMLHSREFWIALTVACFVLVVTAMYEWLFAWRPRNYKSLERLFDDVEITNDEDMCKYPQNPRFLNYHQAIKHLKIHRAWKLWEKIGTTKRDYDEVMKQVPDALAKIIADGVWNNVDFDIKRWKGKGEKPSNWYLDTSDDSGNGCYNLVDAIINESPLQPNNRSDGRFIIDCATEGIGYIAGADSESRRDELMEQIQRVIDNDETRELVGQLRDVENNLDNAKKAFNKKFAKIIKDIQYIAEKAK